MRRRQFLRTAGLSISALSVLSSFKCSDHKSKPNIIIFLIDDLGWKDVGFMGNSFNETPNIDRLAKVGLVFTGAYSNAPNCAPSRASLLTGLYTPRHGIFTVNSSERGESRFRKLIPIPNKETLEPEFATMAVSLKQAGYMTACLGKWHLGDDPINGPKAHGFDINIGGDHTGHPESYFSPYKNARIIDGPDGEYLTDRLTEEALAFIHAHQKERFFLYLSHYAVHTPIQAKPELISKYQQNHPGADQKKAAYAAMIQSIDEGIGRVIESLAELNLTKNTVIFFTSDNGGHGNMTSMTPLRGSKGMLYEGGIRVPMIVSWPGKIAPNSACDVPVITSDLYPTILELASVNGLVGKKLDGESLVPLLFKKRHLQRKAIYWHFPAYLEAYQGMESHWRTTPAGAIRMGDWKLIEFFEDGRLELYNLKEDIGEQNDLVTVRSDIAEDLHMRLKKWRTETQAPVPATLNPEYNPEDHK